MSCDIRDFLDKVRDSYSSLGGPTAEVSKMLSEARGRLVECLVGDRVREAFEWIGYLMEVLDLMKKRFCVKGYTLPKEFNSFISSPIDHLKKKLFIYLDDYVRNRIEFDELLKKASSALSTSLKTNMRSCYQLWGFTTILYHLGEEGYGIAYPEHRFLSFDRSGKQRLGVIPPNVVLLSLEKGFLSFFYEAPRPLSWEDTSDLQRVWSLYTALRPDLMVYSGRVLNIVDLGSTPPIKRPNVIIEFKELEDWYIRVRDLKGYLKKPLTAEEWMHRWWQRLREELEKIAFAKKDTGSGKPKEPSLRVREYQLILLYKITYEPNEMILVSRAKVPPDVRRILEAEGVEVYDDIGFNLNKMKEIAESLDRYASYGSEERITIDIPRGVAKLVAHLSKLLGVDYVKALEIALRKAIDSVEASRRSP